jgi:DNA-binding winged helix-turn-helix (wHTH) protein
MKHFGTFQLDTVNECIAHHGARIALTHKAFAIGRYLIENAGRLVTKDELMDAIWPNVYVQENNLKVYIRELRNVLGDQAVKPQFIETRQGKGYCFIAPVWEQSLLTRDSTRIFGRDVDMNSLQACFHSSLKGERQVVFITGEPGIGKSSLVDAFVPNAEQ